MLLCKEKFLRQGKYKYSRENTSYEKKNVLW
jgi:hypothetical protein